MKYIVPLKIDYDKKQFLEFINRKNLDYDTLAKKKQWHNNFPVEELNIGPIQQYMKDVVLILSLFPKYQIPIHADGAGTRLDNTYNVSINFPVHNCTEETVTHFWDFEDGREIKYIHHENLGTREIVDKDQLVIGQNYIFRDTPVLFRNEYPHSVSNICNDLRLMLSWRFKPEYSWEQAVQLCEQHHLT